MGERFVGGAGGVRDAGVDMVKTSTLWIPKEYV